jgi:hypothetical protein
MGENELNPKAWGYATGIIGTLLYLALRVIIGPLGHGWATYEAMQGLIISNSKSVIWIIPETIQMLIVGFIGGYLIAYTYNRFA